MATLAPRTRTRPANRKQHILAAAADQFCRLGYHNVTMGMIASAVGITGSALYKHFRDKQQILRQVVLDGLIALETISARPPEPDDRGLEGLIEDLASFAVERRGFGLLLQREARNLSPEDQRETQRHAQAIIAEICGLLRSVRPALSAEQAEFLARLAIATALSPSHHRVQPARDQLQRLTKAMTRAALEAPISQTLMLKPSAGADAPAIPGLLASRVSRREALLSASIRMFARAGYPSITMVEIGAVVGITGPSVYNHYGSKADLLMAAMRRGAEWLQMGMETALSAASTAEEALQNLIQSYIDFAFSHNAILENLISEVHHLPADLQREARALQREYAAEWVQLLLDEHPAIEPDTARATVLGLLAVFNESARSMRFVDDMHLRRALLNAGGAMLNSVVDVAKSPGRRRRAESE